MGVKVGPPGVTAGVGVSVAIHPLEFFVALMNNQPMGFYPVETIKKDARRFGVPFLNPCVNRSDMKSMPEGGSVLLGLRIVKDVGLESAQLIVEEREQGGPYIGAGDLVRRTGLRPRAVESLVMAGAFDCVTPNHRQSLWDAELHPSPKSNVDNPVLRVVYAVASGTVLSNCQKRKATH